MSNDAKTGRAAAICEHCGSCHVVRIRADGTVRVIGTNGSCGCGQSDHRILGPDRLDGTDSEPTSGTRQGT